MVTTATRSKEKPMTETTIDTGSKPEPKAPQTKGKRKPAKKAKPAKKSSP